MGHRPRPAGHHRQRRLGAVQRLDRGLLVHAQHDRLAPADSGTGPTTSISFSSNRGSLDTLNVSTRCGFKPSVRPDPLHRGRTDPDLLRHRPARPVCGTGRSGRGGQLHDLGDLLLGDRRLAAPTLSNLLQPANPSSANRSRHARTVVGVTPTSSAITALATPSAAINNARARSTCRCGIDRARATSPTSHADHPTGATPQLVHSQCHNTEQHAIYLRDTPLD